MAKDRFSDNPYPDVQVSDDDRRVLIDLVSGFVDDNFQEFDEFVEIDQQIVDERRWKLAKSRDNQHVYAARSRDGNFQPWQTVGGNDGKPQGKALLSVLGVGTFRGDLDDLMFGAVNPTQDNMRVKASYVGDIDSAAILCPVVEPSDEAPFQSLIIKWMTIDLPLQSTSLVKRRDFVYIEATGFVYLANVETVLSIAKYVQCGEMKKLSWMLQQNHGALKRKSHMQSAHCSMCEKSILCPMSGKQLVGSSTCKLCYGPLCRSCKIKKRLTFIELDGKLDKRKVSFCATCITKATELSAELAAREQAMGYNVHKRLKSISSTTSSQTDISENSSFLEAIMEESDEDEDIPLLSDLSPSEAIPMVF
ncbi:hypothetical protein PF008_g13891 [Phytophthora fragariae]|uniref:FYVE-type domain-containing protein n=1 Tax=Phytophthora fragariae TaxID=53985 RepID=A0A6G0RK16_9STRA|nr:hypothetical protein PF008_g13891 [Phytophthora fragariae]